MSGSRNLNQSEFNGSCQGLIVANFLIFRTEQMLKMTQPTASMSASNSLKTNQLWMVTNCFWQKILPSTNSVEDMLQIASTNIYPEKLMVFSDQKISYWKMLPFQVRLKSQCLFCQGGELFFFTWGWPFKRRKKKPPPPHPTPGLHPLLTRRQVAHQRLVQNKWYPGGQPVTAIEGEDEVPLLMTPVIPPSRLRRMGHWRKHTKKPLNSNDVAPNPLESILETTG